MLRISKNGIITLSIILFQTSYSSSFISTRTTTSTPTSTSIKNIKQHSFVRSFSINTGNTNNYNSNSIVYSSKLNGKSCCEKESEEEIIRENDNNDNVNNIPTEWQGVVLSKLSKIIDPDLNRDIVTLGFIKKLIYTMNAEEKVIVSFDLELTASASVSVKDCKHVLSELTWIDRVDITITAQEMANDQVNDGGILSGLSSIKSIIAVSSCKGGVGKSTTAVNLAYALQSLGGSVGILDVDIYGPSLPTMITPDDENVRFVGRQIAPLQRNGVKLMSFGYINDDAAVMRGPMVNQLLDQLLGLTYWGPLDYLILDMPPGTGDIQLTLSQRLNITAAVIVTTPQQLSFVDVKRGIEMFDSVNVPSIAVVENMAYLDTSINHHYDQTNQRQWEDSLKESFMQKLQQSDNNNDNDNDERNVKLAQELIQIVKDNNKQKQQNKIRLFGNGHKHKLSNLYGIKHVFDIPLLPKIAKQGDVGTPFILKYPHSEQASVFKELASSVVSEISKIKFNGLSHGAFIFNREINAITTTTTAPTTNNDDNNEEILLSIKPKKLREECKCAMCVEELTGKQLLQPNMVSETVVPISMTPCGNYALNVDWSDGHKSLYPYRQILDLMRDNVDTDSNGDYDDDAVKKEIKEDMKEEEAAML